MLDKNSKSPFGRFRPWTVTAAIFLLRRFGKLATVLFVVLAGFAWPVAIGIEGAVPWESCYDHDARQYDRACGDRQQVLETWAVLTIGTYILITLLLGLLAIAYWGHVRRTKRWSFEHSPRLHTATDWFARGLIRAADRTAMEAAFRPIVTGTSAGEVNTMAATFLIPLGAVLTLAGLLGGYWVSHLAFGPESPGLEYLEHISLMGSYAASLVVLGIVLLVVGIPLRILGAAQSKRMVAEAVALQLALATRSHEQHEQRPPGATGKPPQGIR